LIPVSKPKIRVLIVDDSAIVRKILAEAVDSQPDMEVIGTAPDPFVARDKILALKPDVLTLDIEMPRMDGLTFLKKVMRYNPVPTIIISSLGQASTTAALEALRFGAVDVLAKPAGPYSVGDLRTSLANRIRAAASTCPTAPRPIADPTSQQPVPQLIAHTEKPSTLSRFPFHPETILAIGASTGGTIAIQDILQQLPADIPGTVITQHIPAGFSLAFANRLNQLCSMEVREAVDGDVIRPGLVLIAPGDFHLLVRRGGSRHIVELQQGPHVCYQRPSVDVMFASIAQSAGAHALGVLLTGMGTDGAKGLLAMKRSGAPTIAQDEKSCIVYGMPREAARLGAADTVASLHDIPSLIEENLRRHAAPSRLQPTSASTLHHKGVTQ
jgi:two-component system chemotaxis response regulator CheB